MDAQWSIGLAHTYFANPDYLVVQCHVHATFYPLIQLTKQSLISTIILSFLRVWPVSCPQASHVQDLWL